MAMLPVTVEPLETTCICSQPRQTRTYWTVPTTEQNGCI